MKENFSKITAKVHSLVRQGKYSISFHVLNEHPERNIFAIDIVECLKIGSIATAEPNKVRGKNRYKGEQRYRWFGEDQNDRVLRLILVVKANVIVVSAAKATAGQATKYHQEDKENTR